jgi:hypothetical protein
MLAELDASRRRMSNPPSTPTPTRVSISAVTREPAPEPDPEVPTGLGTEYIWEIAILVSDRSFAVWFKQQAASIARGEYQYSASGRSRVISSSSPQLDGSTMYIPGSSRGSDSIICLAVPSSGEDVAQALLRVVNALAQASAHVRGVPYQPTTHVISEFMTLKI